jgi:hypothetical protein
MRERIQECSLVNDPPWRVTVEPVAGDGCTALGCRSHGDLVRVSAPDVDTRVLCRPDAERFLRREVLHE